MRCARFALWFSFGWLALVATHPQPAKSQTAAASADNARVYKEQIKKEDPQAESSCKRGEERRDSELCAQWKAADAAADSAWWAAFAGWFGGLSFLGVLAAVAVALRSNAIARESARRQLRAYVEMCPVEITPIKKGENLTLTVTFINTGQTPARDLLFTFGWKVGGPDTDESFFEIPGPPPSSRAQIGAGQKREIRREMKLRLDEVNGIAQGKFLIYAFGRITYADVFGEKWVTPFRFIYNPSYLNYRFIYAPAGNDAT